MLCWRRLETTDWDHQLIRKVFTEVINQVISGVIFSYAYVKSDFFLKPVVFFVLSCSADADGVNAPWLVNISPS